MPRKEPRRSRRLVRAAKKPSTALSQEALVGVKWQVTLRRFYERIRAHVLAGERVHGGSMFAA